MDECRLNQAIRCHQNNKTYSRVSEAARDLDVSAQSIYRHLYSRNKIDVSGYTFEYAYDHILTAKGKRHY
jgi:hypothetical protein